MVLIVSVVGGGITQRKSHKLRLGRTSGSPAETRQQVRPRHSLPSITSTIIFQQHHHETQPLSGPIRYSMPGLSPSEEVLDSPQYGVLTSYAASDDQTPGEAIEVFCQPIEGKYITTSNSSDIEELLWRAWRALIAVAAGTSHHCAGHRRLAKLVVDLQKRPNLEKDGQPCVVQSMTVWQDLPLFGWEMREAWNAGKEHYSLLVAVR